MASRNIGDYPHVSCIVIDADTVRYGSSEFRRVRKAKARPFPVEKDTGFFDTTKCECGYINDVSATYCGQCGSVIEVLHYAN